MKSNKPFTNLSKLSVIVLGILLFDSCEKSVLSSKIDVDQEINLKVAEAKKQYEADCKISLIRKINKMVDSALMQDPKYLDIELRYRIPPPPKPQKPDLLWKTDSLKIKPLF